MHGGTGQARLQRLLAGTCAAESPLRHVATVPARRGETADWPAWVPDRLREGLRAEGVVTPWTHQNAAAELAHRG
ncbi:MAG: hypothetical protein ACRDTF_21610, partial [Pseudonocardiaceae bacterium]